MPDQEERYPCPCCGYLVFDEGPGSYEICPICFWEDDASQLQFPGSEAPNQESLLVAQQTYAALGVSDRRWLSEVRRPTDSYTRDPGWRPLDPTHDDLARYHRGDHPEAYPEDLTTLYYWRENYWRR